MSRRRCIICVARAFATQAPRAHVVARSAH